MSRKFSLYMLIATVVLIGIVFYRVIQPFIFSLLFATVLTVLFRPFYRWLSQKLGGRPRTAAALTTSGVMLLVLLPLGISLLIAGNQMISVTRDLVQLLQQDGQGNDSELAGQWGRMREAFSNLPLDWQERLTTVSRQAAEGIVKRVPEKTMSLVQDAVNALIGMIVTTLALYYLLADGDTILKEFKELTPLEDAEQDALVEEFGKICRGVVVGTVVAALVQALLAGIGYYFAGLSNVPLMIVLTMILAFIPFVGAGGILTVVSVWLALNEHYTAAAVLFIYSMAIVSTSDNVVRAYIIGSEAKMNPLIAFITVIGAIQLIGLWGIFVGPMIAAFFYTLLKLLRDRLVMHHQTDSP